MKDNKNFYNRTIHIGFVDGSNKSFENVRHSIRNGVFYIYTGPDDMIGIPVRQIMTFSVHKEEVTHGSSGDAKETEGEV